MVTSFKNSTWRLMSHAPSPFVAPPNHSPKDRTTPSPRGSCFNRIRAPTYGRLKLQAVKLIKLRSHRMPHFEGVPTRPVRRSVHIIRGSRSHGSTERIQIIQCVTDPMTLPNHWRGTNLLHPRGLLVPEPRSPTADTRSRREPATALWLAS